ncbi:NAD(P)-binding protein, partial [Fistulina hepatica ATCC 64428]
VVLVDINEDSIIKFANELNERAGRSVALAVKADTTSWTEQLRAFELAREQFKRIDYVFANAGVGGQVWLPSFDPSTAHKRPFVEGEMSALNVCLIGQLHTASLAIQAFERQERNAHGFRGKLVFTSSLFGIFPGPQVPIYVAAKTGLNAFTRSLAPVYEAEGITINASKFPCQLEAHLLLTFVHLVAPNVMGTCRFLYSAGTVL